MSMLSIVIPSNNCGKYINKCLSSIVKARLPDIEVIIVDDLSTDQTKEIIKEFKKDNPEIKIKLIINKKNIGPGRSRNKGIDSATGKYLIFIDADDYFSSKSLFELYSFLASSDVDVALFNHRRIYDSGKKRKNKKSELFLRFGSRYLDKTDIGEMINNFPVAWNKAYRLDFIRSHNIKFYSGYYEDIPWSYTMLALAKTIYCLDSVVYNYVIRTGSILNTADKKHLDIVTQYRRLFNDLKSRSVDKSYIDLLIIRMQDHFIKILTRHMYRFSPMDTLVFYEKASRVLIGYLWESSTAINRLPIRNELVDLLHDLMYYGKYYAVSMRREYSHRRKIRQFLVRRWGVKGLKWFDRYEKLLNLAGSFDNESLAQASQKVSIIIPCFNAEKTLSDTLASVCEQTHGNLDILCVDDGSTDNTAALIADYMNSDSRIRYIARENGGPGAARNTGISQASAELIVFMDADDSMPASAIETLVQAQIASGSDIVVGTRYTKLYGELKTDVKTVFSETILNTDCVKTPSIFNLIAVTAKLYRKKYLSDRHIVFPEGMTSEDFVFTYEAYIKTDNISVVSDHVYTYTWGSQDGQSITENRNSPFNLQSRFRQIEMTLAIARTGEGKNRLPYKNPYKVEFGSRLIRHIEASFFTDKYDRTVVLSEIYDFSSRYKNEILAIKDPYINAVYTHLFNKNFTAIEPLVREKRSDVSF